MHGPICDLVMSDLLAWLRLHAIFPSPSRLFAHCAHLPQAISSWMALPARDTISRRQKKFPNAPKKRTDPLSRFLHPVATERVPLLRIFLLLAQIKVKRRTPEV